MKVVIDASVALKWFIEEPGSAAAAKFLAPGIVRLAPDLIFAEAGNAAWKALRRGLIMPAQYSAVAERLTYVLTEATPIAALSPRACQIAQALDHPVYDAFYLALAEARDAPLVTADARLVERAGQSHWRDRVKNLYAWID